MIVALNCCVWLFVAFCSRKLYRPLRKFAGYLESLLAIWELSRPSGNFPEHLKIFRTTWKFSRLFGNFLGHLGAFQAIWELSRPSINFPGQLENFKTLWKFKDSVCERRNVKTRVLYIESCGLKESSRLSFLNNWSRLVLLKIKCVNILMSRFFCKINLCAFYLESFCWQKSATWKVVVFSVPGHGYTP